MITIRQSCVLVLGLCILALACEHDGVMDVQRPRESNVQIDLRALDRGSSPNQQGTCSSLVDSVSLLVDPEGGSQQQYAKKLAQGDSVITFTVKVDQGSVQFAANVLSNNQTLLYSKTQRTEVKANGFQVGLQLDKKAPVMVVCPDLLVVAWQSSATFLIENIGIGDLNWRIVTVPPRLTINPASGSLPAQGRDTIVVQSYDSTRETFPMRFDSQAGHIDLAIQKVVVTPAAPTLVSPPDAATNVSIKPTTLTWNASSGAMSYQLQVSTSSTFSTTVVNQSGLGTTSYATSGLVSNTTYFWRVNASNPAGTSPFSSAWQFTTVAALAAPTLIAPRDSATNVSTNPTTFTWNAPAGATSFQLQVSRSSTFRDTVVNQSGISSTSYSITSLANGITYYWRVRASNAGGQSPFSSTWRFTTIVAPLAPALVSPPNGATNIPASPITFTWNVSTGATSYQLQVSTNSSFSSTVVDRDTISNTSSSVTGLANDTTYYWRVRASNAGGTSPFSSTWRFTTLVAPPGPPTLILPADGATGVSIRPTTFTWNPSGQQASYQLQVSKSSTFSDTVVNQSGITPTSYLASGLANGTTYYWHVRASNAGGTSPFSITWRFTTIVAPPAAPTLLSPGDGATNVSINPTRFTWSASSEASSYHLQFSTDSTFLTRVVNHSGITATSYADSTLTGSTTYFWRINATNPGGTSPYSSTWRFTTVAVIFRTGVFRQR